MGKRTIAPKGVDDDGFIADLAEGIGRYFYRKYGEIDLEVIAYENGISYSYGDYGLAFDGMIEFFDRNVHIFINTKGYRQNNRSRFTFAHELGHFYISEHATALMNGHTPAHSSFTGFKSNSIVEQQADHFAANLLMPYYLLIEIYRKNRTFQFEIIEDVKKAFGVSRLAALYRIFMLNLHPMMIVTSKKGQISHVQWNDGFYLKLNSKTELPEDAIATAYFSTGKKFTKTQKIWAIDWFNVDDNQHVYERCIYYDSVGEVISVIWED